MPILRIDEFPEGSGNLSNDDVFLFMDDPSGSGVTKKISLSQISSVIGGGGGSGTSFQITTVDLHNGGIQNAQVLQFDNTSYQSVITGPTPASGNNSQRIIIQGQRAQGAGEGGDVYLWGGDADTNGGDIKIYAGDADDPSSGQGGYVNIDGGNGYNQGGNVSISAGNSSTQGGNVSISAGNPSGNITINTNTASWAFNADSTVSLPNNTLDAGLNSIDIKSSQYAELYFESGPSGTSNNYIENPDYNSESYIWTAYDGSYIQNVRSNDGSNPYWNQRWEFTNHGDLNLPEGRVLNFGQGDTLGGPQAGGTNDRIRLWDFKGAGSNFNYAIGVEPNHVWFSMDVNNGEGGFKFYSRSNEIFKISDDSKLMFPNGTTITTGTFDNGTGGNNGISLNCYVGYELNWQGGHLKSTQDGGLTAAHIWCDSSIEFPGSNVDNMEINSSGLIFPDGSVQTTAPNDKCYGSFYDTTTQTNPSVSGVNTMVFNTVDLSHNISMVDNSKLTFHRTSTYNIQFSAQLDKTDGGDDAVDIWLSKNNADFEWSNTRISMHQQDAKTVAAWNFMISANSGDYIEFKWYSADPNMRILAESGLINPTRPNIPSIILTANEI